MDSIDLSSEDDRKEKEEARRIEELILKQRIEYIKAIKNLNGSYTLKRKDQLKLSSKRLIDSNIDSL